MLHRWCCIDKCGMGFIAFSCAYTSLDRYDERVFVHTHYVVTMSVPIIHEGHYGHVLSGQSFQIDVMVASGGCQSLIPVLYVPSRIGGAPQG